MMIEDLGLKHDLVRRSAYAPLQPSRVELVETHISWVFLLDDDVFKVKKPVDLGFLDFRSIEQRRAACEAELRLNRRLAPNVYRDVVPVRLGADGRRSIGGQGAIVDWAVHMVRLGDDGRADRLLQRAELSGDAIDSVAQHLAAFHGAARCDDEISRFGAPSVIRQNVEENFAQTRGTLGKYLSPEETAEICAWQMAFVDTHPALFEQRARTGRVRDGHGDIRLEHVYLGSGPPRIIDCIEFNERFRFGDVCSDVAFLSMDLARCGRRDLAERLLASYARESNDFDLYAVVDFYESYRAFVRGKIAALTAADQGIGEATRERAEQEARRYFLLALADERPSLLAPMIVAVGGVIASGKSSIAGRIAAEMSAPIVEADRTRKAMLGVAPLHQVHDEVWQGAYDPEITQQVYAEMLRRADVVLASGRPVVIDASFRGRSLRDAARALAGHHKVPFVFVECRVDAALARERLRTRQTQGSVSDGRLEIFDAFSASFEQVTELEASEHVILDTSRPVDENLTRIRSKIDVWPSALLG